MIVLVNVTVTAATALFAGLCTLDIIQAVDRVPGRRRRSPPAAEGIRADLAGAGVRLIDAAADDDRPPPVSSIAVTAGTGRGGGTLMPELRHPGLDGGVAVICYSFRRT